MRSMIGMACAASTAARFPQTAAERGQARPGIARNAANGLGGPLLTEPRQLVAELSDIPRDAGRVSLKMSDFTSQ